jgi:predicted permease
MEEDLEKEIRFQLEQHTADLIAQGHDPEEARREARLALGGPEQVKEACRDARGTRWLEDLLQDLRYAVRTLRRRPGFAAVALCTLALGAGATTVMFTVFNGVLLKPLSYHHPENLVTLYGPFSYLNFLDCQHESRSLAMAAWHEGGGTVSRPGEADYFSGREVSANLFSVLGVNLLRGRAFLPEEDRAGGPPVAIISYRLWQQRYGGSPAAVGQELVFDGKVCTVTGVAPPDLRLSGDADVFTPLGQNPAPYMQNREMNPGIRVVARLEPGITLAQARAELALIDRRLTERYSIPEDARGITVQPLQQAMVADVRSTLWLLLGAVSLVLLIACVNVASLLLARAVSRERELALRVALGAGRGRLIRQCLTESLVLALSGGTLGIILALVGTRPFVAFWPGSLPRAEEVQADWRVLLFAVTLSLVSGLIFGLAPALRAPAQELEQILRDGARTVAGSSRRLHSSFVISEIAFAVVLLVAAGMLGRTMLRLSAVNPGIDVRNLLVTRVALSPNALASPEATRAAWRDILNRTGGVPGVKSVATTDIVPMTGENDGVNYTTAAAEASANQFPRDLMLTVVSPDYLKPMGIPLRQGRFFDERDGTGSEPVAVIDEELAQHAFRGMDPVGNRLWVHFIGPLRVVGVVGHVRHWGLDVDDDARVGDQVYLPFAQVPEKFLRSVSSGTSLVIRTAVPPLNVLEAVRRQVQIGRAHV